MKNILFFIVVLWGERELRNSFKSMCLAGTFLGPAHRTPVFQSLLWRGRPRTEPTVGSVSAHAQTVFPSCSEGDVLKETSKLKG